MEKRSTPLVSVVIITYNSSKYIVDTLESIKNQDYNNIELIVSDDASKDNTVEVCSAWLDSNSEHFTGTKLITVPHNTGVSANCNRGAKASSGEWIKTISGDDRMLSSAISDNLNYAHSVPGAAFIISDIREIDENGLPIEEGTLNEGLAYFANIPTAKKQLKAYSRWPAFLNTPTFFCKTDIMKAINYCDEEFRIYEDMTVILRVVEKGYRLHYLPKKTVEYRIHRESISRNRKMDELRKNEAFKVFKKYRKKHLNIFNPIDLSVLYEIWLNYKYKGFNGRKGDSLLRKFSLFYWYMRFSGIKSY